jgi:hypothetical protein
VLKTIIKSVLVMAMVLSVRQASASPRTLPFSYPYETLAEHTTEVELYGDMTPLRVNAVPGDPSKGRIYEPAYVLQTEFEYGITDKWELGLYQQFVANPQDGGTNSMTFDGFKWRIRHRFSEAGELPVDVAVYLELETLHDELALEGKIILAKHFGSWHWMANLWAEEEDRRPYDGQHSLVFIINPTTGITYQVSPVVHFGAEYWARGALDTSGEARLDAINDRVHHFVGPTFHANFGELWWTLGLYADLNNVNNPQPGEAYGAMWMRSVIGINL